MKSNSQALRATLRAVPCRAVYAAISAVPCRAVYAAISAVPRRAVCAAICSIARVTAHTAALCIATTLAAIILTATVGDAHFIRSAHADPSHSASHDGAPPWQELQSRVQSLEAREEIRILMHDYGRLLDERNFDAFAQLFAAQSEYDSGGMISKGPTAIAAFLKDIIGRNPAGYKTPNFHIFFNESIEVQGDRGTAVSKSAFVVPGEGNKAEAVILANYHDVFIRENGRWKFLKRVVRSDIPAPKPK